MRIGTASEPMPQSQIEQLFSSRTRNSIGKIKSNRQDLTFELLKIYYHERKKKLNDKFKTNLELLTPNNELNYVAYLLSDENNISVKVAKYRGTTKVDVIERNEYGYTSIIKACKSVLDKVDIENKTFIKITAKEREETQMWNKEALREAIINAFVHNDYTKEIAPTIEIYSDRIEVTSAGSLQDLKEDEFFSGFSIPRNKELMRVFKDLDLVEQLGSGIPRILETYGRESFIFTPNFLRISMPTAHDEGATPQDNQLNNSGLEKITPHDTPHDSEITDLEKKLLLAISTQELSRVEIMENLDLSDRTYLAKSYLKPSLDKELIEMTIPNSPKSKKQKYRLTALGKQVLESFDA